MFVGEWIMELVYQILGDSIDDGRVKAKRWSEWKCGIVK